MKQSKKTEKAGAPEKPQKTEAPEETGILKREQFFPTLIYFQDLTGSKPLNDELKQHIHAWRVADPKGISRSNVQKVGAWHSPIDMHRREEYRALTTEIREVAEQVFLDLGYDPDYQPVIDNMWANINPRYAYNRSHTHPDSLWSGVYYVQVPPDSGRLCFVDPRPQAGVIVPFFPRNVTPKPEQWAEVYHEPVEGRMVLFPAWLQHEVQPNMSELDGPAGSRISVSFNLIQRRRQDPRDSAGQPPADAGAKPGKP